MMATEPTDPINTDGAEPGYGPAYTDRPTGKEAFSRDPAAKSETVAGSPEGAVSPPYTAPYPPYPSDVPPTYAIAPNVAAGLAYMTLLPAVVFLLIEPYRSHPLVRFHSLQSVFLFMLNAMALVVIGALGTALPAVLIVLMKSLISLLFVTAWLVAMGQAFAGKKYSLPWIGPMAERIP
jgi:uncharacterized membrane protein